MFRPSDFSSPVSNPYGGVVRWLADWFGFRRDIKREARKPNPAAITYYTGFAPTAPGARAKRETPSSAAAQPGAPLSRGHAVRAQDGTARDDRKAV